MAPRLSKPRFPDRIIIRCPPLLCRAIDEAATKNLSTQSDYVRRAIIDRLKEDGIDITKPRLKVVRSA